MSQELKIPEDLKERYAELHRWIFGPITEDAHMPAESGLASEAMLIQRIARLEQYKELTEPAYAEQIARAVKAEAELATAKQLEKHWEARHRESEQRYTKCFGALCRAAISLGIEGGTEIVESDLVKIKADRLAQENATLRESNRRLEEQKDGAYAERDKLVALLSKVFPAWLERHPDSDSSWDDDWRSIVFFDLPTGQASWHIHDSELWMFEHLQRREGNSWDGHTTAEKYARCALVAARQQSKEGQQT